MNVNIEIGEPEPSIAEFDEKILMELSSDPRLLQSIEQAFKLKARVPDVWRYVFQVSQGNASRPKSTSRTLERSKFSDRNAVDAEGMNTVLVLLESPHIDEFEAVGARRELLAIAPAQGTGGGGAGRAIDKFLYLLLEQLGLPDGEYAVILANPIQYHCSLSLLSSTEKLKPRLRNYVWRVLWALPSIQRDFLRRYKMYRPSAVINCCTGALRPDVRTFLTTNEISGKVFEAEHPASRWNIQNSQTGTVAVKRIC